MIAPTLAVTLALEPTPVGRAGDAPVGEHVVGEVLVVGHHVEVGVDGGAVLGDVDGDGDGLGRSHGVPHGTLLADGWQGPAREAPRRRDRPHRRARDLRPQPARAGGRDRHQPPHAHPPLRQPRGAVGGGHPRRRGTPARAAGGGHPRSRRVGRRRACASGGRTSPASRCGPTSGCSSRSTARRCRAGRGRSSCSTGSSTAGSSRRRRASWPTAWSARRRWRRRGSGWRSAAGCCWTCWPPATATAVDAANEAYIALVEARLAGYSGPHSPDRR